MHLTQQLTHTALKPYYTEISQRSMTGYAAAVQDPNPVYFDDEQAQGPPAHPVFPVAVTWPVLSRLEKFIGSDDFPSEVLLTQVHYSEHLILHRLIRPDDRLNISGRIEALLPHRSGTHALIRLDATDPAGNPVFTEITGAMLRGISCEEGLSATDLPQTPEPPPFTQALWTASIDIDPLQPHVYDGCTGIEFPIHTSPAFAKMVGLPGIILQGTATLAHAVREIVNREAGGNPERISEIACRFTGMVVPGTRIEVLCTAKTRSRGFCHLFFEVKNSADEKAIRHGYIKIKE